LLSACQFVGSIKLLSGPVTYAQTLFHFVDSHPSNVPVPRLLLSQCRSTERKGQSCHPSHPWVSSRSRTFRLTCSGPARYSVGCACEDEEPSGGWECGHHQHNGLQPNCPLCVLTLWPAKTTIIATRPATSTTAKAASPTRRRRVCPPVFAAAMMGELLSRRACEAVSCVGCVACVGSVS